MAKNLLYQYISLMSRYFEQLQKKKGFLTILIAVLGCAFSMSTYAQQQYAVTVTNVKVPLWVMDGDRFVQDLNLADFEVYENGQLQESKALYLMRNGQIARMDALRDYMPMTSRQFYFLFQILDYNPKITEAIEYFFNHVFVPGDAVVIQTPVKNYALSPERAQSLSTQTLSKDMQFVVRKDAQIGAMEYKTLLKELKQLVRAMSTAGGTGNMVDLESSSSVGINSLQFQLPRYRDTLQKMEQMRLIDEKWFLRFASQLKRSDQEKVVYFFYQREYRPEIQASILNRITSNYQDDANIMGQVQDLFQVYHRELTLDVDRLKHAYADDAIHLNFFFFNKTPETVSGVHMREQSEDVFRVFSQIAEATGGIVDNSQNPAAAFKSTSQKIEFCYLLYYSPREYIQDGKFRTIEVKLKNRNFRVIHRLGYFSQ